MSVLPVSSLMGNVMLIPSKLAIRSSVPQSWAKASSILGWLRSHGYLSSCQAGRFDLRSDLPHKCFMTDRVSIIEPAPELSVSLNAHFGLVRGPF